MKLVESKEIAAYHKPGASKEGLNFQEEELIRAFREMEPQYREMLLLTAKAVAKKAEKAKPKLKVISGLGGGK